MSDKTNIEHIWAKIKRHEGQVFSQLRGKKFTYSVIGNSVKPSTTNRLLPKGQFEKALARMPLTSTVPIQHLQGPSYLFAILTDERIAA